MLLAPLLLFVLIDSGATCEGIDTIQQHPRSVYFANGVCNCPSAQAGYPHETPSGFKLKGWCGSPGFGPYHFSGFKRIAGTITRVESFTFGDYTNFQPNPDERFDGISEFRFSTNVNSNVDAPEISIDHSCWAAEATIDVYDFNVDFESNDSSGAYIDLFTVVKVEAFIPCTEASSNEPH